MTANTPVIQPPKTPTQRMRERLQDLRESEQDLASQQPSIHAYEQKLASYVERYEYLREKERDLPEGFIAVEQVWRRLQWEPVNPAEMLELHFVKAAEKLRNDNEELLTQLEQIVEKRVRLLHTWRSYVEEIQFKQRLLPLLEERMEQFELGMLKATTEASQPLTEAAQARLPQPAPQAASELPMSTQEDLPKAAAANGKELRQYTRLNIGRLLEFGPFNHTFYTGFSENISSGGLFIATYEMQPSVGDRYAISFKLDEQTRMELPCEVVWIREYSENSPDVAPGFGCRFLEMDPQEQRVIDAFIAQQGSLFIA